MGKKFNLYGEILEISDACVNYNTIILNIKPYQEIVKNEYKKTYYQKFPNMDAVMEENDDFDHSYLLGALEWSVGYLAENKIYNYDVNLLWNKLRERDGDEQLSRIEMKMLSEYSAIIYEQADAMDQRRDRKDFRDRMEGDGSLEGALLAGTFNLMSGAAHSVANAAGNTASAVNASMKKNKMYKDESYPDAVADALVHTLQEIAYTLVEVLRKEKKIQAKYPSEDEKAEVAVIVKNINAGYMKEKDEIKKNCINCMKKDPYNEQLYELLRSNYDDPKGELAEVADFFGIKVIELYKEGKIKEILSKMNYFSLDGIKDCKNELLEWAALYHVDTKLYEQNLEAVWTLVEERERIVDGLVYETKENAEYNKNEVLEYIGQVKDTSANDIETINRILGGLETSEIKSKDKYITYLKEELKKEDIRYKSIKGFSFDTREEARIAREKAEEIDKLLFNIANGKELSEVKEKISALEAKVLQELYTAYLNKSEEIWNNQTNRISNDYENADLSRKELMREYHSADLLRKDAGRYGCLNQEYVEWFERFTEYCTTVNGVKYNTPHEADKAYFKWIEHARHYLTYITEKNAAKKSLFGSLKNATTGLVYKNYEADYNSLTENGSKAIPNDPKDDLKALKDDMVIFDNMLTSNEKEFTEKHTKIRLSSKMENKSMDMSSLYIETLPVCAKEVKQIMEESCPDIKVYSTGHDLLDEMIKTQKGDDEKFLRDAMNDLYEEMRLISCEAKQEETISLLQKYLNIDTNKAEELVNSVPVNLGKAQGVTGLKLEELFIEMRKLNVKVEWVL